MLNTYMLEEKDFAEVFGGMTSRVAAKIKKFHLTYTDLSKEERDECILRITKGLVGSEFEVVGAHRQEKWEKGWGENLTAFKERKEGALIPYYFQKDQIARWRQELVKPMKPGFDYGALTIILEWLYKKYMKEAGTIYEFGCGTGHHLLQLQEINPKAMLVGLDWAIASQNLLDEMIKRGVLKNASSRRFDFFEPDYSLDLSSDSVVYTVAALEQVGERHTAFVDYLMNKKPSLCVHVEPIAELLNPEQLLDFLSIEYFRKRKYLWNFLTHLRTLEKKGKIKIHDARRTYLGGNMYVDHYSVIVWSPVR